MTARAPTSLHHSLSSTTMSPLSHRRSLPDVPEDIEDDIFLHLNDPNYDLHSDASSTVVGSDSEPPIKLTHKYEEGWTSVATESPQSESEFQLKLNETQARSQDKITLTEQTLEDSPYPEVRAAVSNTDEPLMPVNTFRVWVIGIAFSILIPAFNTVFSFRYPSVAINALFVQVVTLPIGKLFERIMPKRTWSVGGYTMSLNPGPFNIKEHTLISVMANIVVNGAPFAEVSAVQTFILKTPWPLARQFILGIAIQLIGFSFAGMVREFLVWPATMIWPGVLVRSALLNTMHNSYGKQQKKHMSRERFLFFACLCSFVWYWVPGFLFTGLSIFNWVCWIVPDNVVVNTLFGYRSGLGFGFLTFDWAMVSYVSNPLVVPWWAQLNAFSSFVLWIWIVVPILWAKNVFFAKFMPISAPGAFNRNGTSYDQTAILTDGIFDQQKYEQYGPIFLTITFLVTYGTCCASYTAVIVHTILWYRRDIVRQFRKSLRDQNDVHSRLMRVYDEVPRWWYIGLGLISFALAVVGIEICDTKLPVWGLIIALLISVLFLIPLGIVQAISNQQFSLHIFAEIIAGLALPGRPLAGLVFKAFASNTTSQALVFVGDLKIGHYMKIPPRMMWICQVVASIVAVFTSFLVQTWAFNNIEDICTPDQKDFFTCPNMIKYGTASFMWSAIGPRRLFAAGALYAPLAWFFLIGALLPIPFWYLANRYPRSWYRYVHIPIQLNVLYAVPPATGINFSSSIFVGFIFQWFMRRFHFRWWMRHVYILSSGLDAGVILGVVIIFFTLQVHKHSVFLNWWGNTVWQDTADARGTPFIQLAPGESFGPTTWS